MTPPAMAMSVVSQNLKVGQKPSRTIAGTGKIMPGQARHGVDDVVLALQEAAEHAYRDHRGGGRCAHRHARVEADLVDVGPCGGVGLELQQQAPLDRPG